MTGSQCESGDVRIALEALRLLRQLSQSKNDLLASAGRRSAASLDIALAMVAPFATNDDLQMSTEVRQRDERVRGKHE